MLVISVRELAGGPDIAAIEVVDLFHSGRNVIDHVPMTVTDDSHPGAMVDES